MKAGMFVDSDFVHAGFLEWLWNGYHAMHSFTANSVCCQKKVKTECIINHCN